MPAMSGFLNRWRALIGVRSTGASVLLVLFLISLPIITPRIRGADEIEYFSYLHSLWIDGDLEFGNEYQYFYDRDPAGLAAFKSTFLDRLEPTGHHINFGPIGSALLWSPIYLLVHAGMLLMRACGGSVVADGFSRPYEIAACYTSVTYGFTGLLLIYHALKRSGAFSERAATGSVIALWWGSPVLYYMTIAPGFSHATSLFAVSLLLWLWLRARQSAALALRTGFVLGLAGGLAGLVREQDVFFVVIPAIDALAQGWRCRRIARSLRHVTA
ncbi:MAG: hypothetical protein MUF51_06225, partial [Vicinamibacteria bacterium]|nr:hypothetical protein [Vicinamibacteria bacterium]